MSVVPEARAASAAERDAGIALSPSTMQGKRIPQLDGVRGVAILLILVWHYVANQLYPAEGTLLWYVTAALGLTWSGVDLFFVLSGFLIAGILLDNRTADNYFRVFYVRRVCRIFPLYFLLLGAFVVARSVTPSSSARFAWLLDDPLPLWSYATFTQNFLMGPRGDFGPHWLGVTWSLAVEEQFYLVIPFLIFFLSRRPLVALLVLAVIAAPLIRLTFPGFHTFVSTPARADSLLTGALLAAAVRWPPFLTMARRYSRVLLVVLGILVAGAAVLTTELDLMGAFNHTYLAALYAVLVLIAFLRDGSIIERALEQPVLVWFGQLSYGIYMFHQVVSGLLHGWLRNGPPQIDGASSLGVTLAALGMTLGLATLSYRYFEAPFLRLGHRTRYMQDAAAGGQG